MTLSESLAVPQAKICGLTVPQEAAACAALGATVIGLVFYPPSPRHVELEQGRQIQAALPGHVQAVGVFVNPAWDFICQAIQTCRLGGVQLHGNEAPELVARLRSTFDLTVIKVLFAAKEPRMKDAGRYEPDAFLVEAGKGVLPGGNAETWDWVGAKSLVDIHPTILAGGLSPENLEEAVMACLPDAVDVSSGVESTPGRKDLAKVQRFIEALGRSVAAYRSAAKTPRPIFHTRVKHR
jgi:phosphoribosylanthranilate isomerase